MYEEWKAQQSGVLSPIQREFVNRLASPRTKALKQSPQTKIDSPPAQPAPVPLTDEQINNAWLLNGGGLAANRYYDFARAIEAAHGITEKGQQ